MHPSDRDGFSAARGVIGGFMVISPGTFRGGPSGQLKPRRLEDGSTVRRIPAPRVCAWSGQEIESSCLPAFPCCCSVAAKSRFRPLMTTRYGYARYEFGG
jgi:hypothetical protein